MSDIKEIISKVNGMQGLKEKTIIALQKDIRDLKNLMKSIESGMQEKKMQIKEKDLLDTVAVNDSVEQIAPKEIIQETVSAPEIKAEVEKIVEIPAVKEEKPVQTEVVETKKVEAVKPQETQKKNVFIPNSDRQYNRQNRPFDGQNRNRDNNRDNKNRDFSRDNRNSFNKDGKTGYNKDNRNNNANNGAKPFNKDRNNFNRFDAPPAPIVKENTQKKKKTFEKDENKKQLNKRTLIKKGYVENGFDNYDDDGVVRIHKQKKAKKVSDFTPNTVKIENAVVESQIIPIKTLAEKIGIQSTEIVKKLFSIGQLCNINSSIDFDTAELVAIEFGITLEYKPQETAEDILIQSVLEREVEGELVKRPPVVTIMGHVDHGKTSLLDYIRKSKVVSGEAGGITQHIGAYTIELNGEPITFLDTPGHEAFTSMRKRGAMVTDIAIIVVAADDGIMPQTVEAISHAKEAGVDIMIAINKMDKAQANPNKVMEEMGRYDLVPEDRGGSTMVYPVSAKTGMGVDDLLEGILLLAEYKELKAVKDCGASGTIIEARLDKGVGPIATCLIQNGTLKVGDNIVAGTVVGKVRALIDNNGKKIKSAGPGIAVSVHGLSDVPNAGDQVICVADDKLAKKVAQERYNKEREEMQSKSKARSLDDMFKGVSSGERKSLGVVIKGDVQGSVEAVKQEFIKLGESVANDNVVLTIMHAGVGAINESDVMLADTGNAVIVGFNVRPEPKARLLAEKNGVDIKIYRVIYDAIDDIQKALKGMLAPVFREEELGHAEVRETFNITKVGTIAGCYVTDGKVQRNAKFRLIRDNVVIYEGSISSMKRNKDEAKEVAAGYECGIGLAGFNDIKVGDIIEAFILKEEER